LVSKDSLIKKLLIQHLPPYSFRVGLSEKNINNDLLPGEWLQEILLTESQIGSLNGLIIDIEDMPGDIKDITNLFDLLSPGGIAIIYLKSATWSNKKIKEICIGSGFNLKFISPRLYFFSPSRKGSYVVFEKPAITDSFAYSKKLSIVIPCSEICFKDVARAFQSWQKFLVSRNIQNETEYVLVNDAKMSNEDFASLENIKKENEIVPVHHYRRFGEGPSMISGIIHASGKWILIDESAGDVPPEELFELINESIREDTKKEDSILTAYHGYQSPHWKLYRNLSDTKKITFTKKLQVFHGALVNNLLLIFSGSREPLSDFRLYSRKTAFLIEKNISNIYKNHRLKALHFLGKQRIQVKDTAINRLTISENNLIKTMLTIIWIKFNIFLIFSLCSAISGIFFLFLFTFFNQGQALISKVSNIITASMYNHPYYLLGIENYLKNIPGLIEKIISTGFLVFIFLFLFILEYGLLKRYLACIRRSLYALFVISRNYILILLYQFFYDQTLFADSNSLQLIFQPVLKITIVFFNSLNVISPIFWIILCYFCFHIFSYYLINNFFRAGNEYDTRCYYN